MIKINDGLTNKQRYRLCHPEKNKKYMMEYHKKNKNKEKEYRQKNKEKINQKTLKWRINNQEKYNEYHKIYSRIKKPKDITQRRKIRSRSRRHIPILSGCEFCASKKSLERHHPSYDEGMENVFVTCCKSCHYYLNRGTIEIEGSMMVRRTD